MSTRPFHGIRTAIVALAAIATTVPLLHAEDLSAEQAYLDTLLAPKTIITAKATVLATEVSMAITSNTSGFTATELAAAAFTPLAGKVRADRNASAATVVASAIGTLSVSDTGGGFDADVAAMVDAVVDVNGGNSKEELSTRGQTAVVKAALGTLSDAAAGGTVSLLAADQTIGQTLANDAYLEGLGAGGLSKILDGAIAGINGAKGKSAAVAPEAAQDYIAGILESGSLPNVSVAPTALDYGSFAVTILKAVSKNTSVDEAGAFAVATEEGSSNQANLVTLATSLFAKYAPGQAKITQGIAAVIPITSGSDEARATFFGSLTSSAVKDAVAIQQGATFVDPYHADNFLASVFNAVNAAPGGSGLITGDATKIATPVGQTLGADGDELTDIAVTYGDFITAGTLPASSAASYATAMLNGAIAGLPKGSILTYTAAAQGIGGQLNSGKTGITTAITEATVKDLAAIVDSMALGVLSSTGNTEAKIASDIGALIKGVASITKNEQFTLDGTPDVNVAAYLAGSLASTIVTPGNASGAEQAAIDAAIDSSMKTVVNKTVYGTAPDPAAGTVLAEVASPTYTTVGAITFAETAVTNL